MSYINEKKEALLVIAYPELSADDKTWIDQFRKNHDPLFYGVVEPHFTLVFPTFGFEYEAFTQEIKEKAMASSSFEFVIRCAMMNNDKLSEYYHIFLVPDEGYSNIAKLHKVLYSELIKDTLLLDVDFIPHIGIGSFKDKIECKRIVDSINDMNLTIKGSVNSLSIISYSDGQVNDKGSIELPDSKI